jgi:hypothetical protein
MSIARLRSTSHSSRLPSASMRPGSHSAECDDLGAILGAAVEDSTLVLNCWSLVGSAAVERDGMAEDWMEVPGLSVSASRSALNTNRCSTSPQDEHLKLRCSKPETETLSPAIGSKRISEPQTKHFIALLARREGVGAQLTVRLWPKAVSMEPEDEKTSNALRLNVPPDATRPRRLGDRVIGSMTAHGSTLLT